MTFRHWFFRECADLKNFFECLICGAVVSDRKKHDTFHQVLEKKKKVRYGLERDPGFPGIFS